MMKLFGVDANIVALSGIAIAVGTVVDMGIVICENIVKHIKEATAPTNYFNIVYEASSEVAGAILTSVATTIVSFLPVFMLQHAEGKLFRPLAFTKTFTIAASCILALFIIPPIAHLLFKYGESGKKNKTLKIISALILIIAIIYVWNISILVSILLIILLFYNVFLSLLPPTKKGKYYIFLYWLVPVIFW